MLPSQAGRRAASGARAPGSGRALCAAAATGNVVSATTSALVATTFRIEVVGRTIRLIVRRSPRSCHPAGLAARRQLPEALGQPQVLGIVDRDLHEGRAVHGE